MRSDYPKPHSEPPMSKEEEKIRQGANLSLVRPTVWDTDMPFYEWIDPMVDDYPISPLPKGCAFEHMNLNPR